MKGGSGTPTGREESSLSAFVFLQQLYLTFSQAVIRQTAGQTVDVSFLSHFFFFFVLPPLCAVHVLPATEAKDSVWSLFEGESTYF